MATAMKRGDGSLNKLNWRMIILAAMIGAAMDAAWFSTVGWLQGSSGYVVLQATGGFFLGNDAVNGGFPTFLFGLATHLCTATLMATGFALLQPRLKIFQISPWLSGLIYGTFLYALMFHVVLPLRWPTVFPRFDGWYTVGDYLIHPAISIVFAYLIGGRYLNAR